MRMLITFVDKSKNSTQVETSLSPLNRINVRELARKIRLHALRMTRDAGSSHVGSSFSMAELLAVLYADFLRVDPKNIDAPDRDRLILSKGHACAGLYGVLAESGFFPIDWL